ncbi:phosphonate ABC transporter, periplasmic phosphonate-binding protein [Alkalidesulfovibrio alkalitolerans DSM 16529]|uniref:Phosphonate ABC transporter, periplasmic phosphonate-binding protein n=1 Tax=Alkalidesulfovibrio alkalitolerans DSM 16529 TaxID=1121439 RepID=S7T734_9BACT|nr:phosphate/phosphite/phosphonate ABC transporter substrate-binding protein [Alkalidesulfovibrio alkalitolerans]EPR32386.1 phosphonate ABC transporter, periplasmic phosphonate-binding protein [Alkalidesulfovibrio alkalitolerans DSM 16529]
MRAKILSPLFMLLILAAVLAAPLGLAAQECANRGSLDPMFCDEDLDLVADPPKDPAKFKNPDTLIFTYTPVEDPAVYRDVFKPFMDYLAEATGKKVVYYTVHSNAAQIEAMRSGRLHVAGFSTGPTGFAVNLAGAVPIAVKGGPDGFQGYQLVFIVRSDSPYQTLADLKGKKVAHTSASSNSGNLAPRVLLPKEGLTPEQDYEVLFSGKHDQSVLGVASGDYDGAPVASDVFDRMVARGTVKGEDFRILYRSATFPTSSFAYAHDLHPDLVRKIVGAFHTYRFTPEMKKAFGDADRFYPITYKVDWDVVRMIAEGTGTSYSRGGFEKEFAKELQKQ